MKRLNVADVGVITLEGCGVKEMGVGMLSSEMIGEAKKYRKEGEQEKKGGVVVFFGGEVQGWVNELRDPQTWQPGCVALDEKGNQWVARGGNYQDGAECWEHIIKAA